MAQDSQVDSATAGRDWQKVDLYERFLAGGSVLLLIAVLTALVRGHRHWDAVPTAVWIHLGTIIVALALTPVMLSRRRGDMLHRAIGWLWALALFATAAVSLLIRQSNHGGFSVIHILSAFTLIQVPLILWSARTHNVARHRGSVRGMVTGALLIAGFFTFPFDRMLGVWLSGG